MGGFNTGGTTQTGTIDLQTPQQKQFLSGALSGQGPAGQAYQSLIQPGDFNQEFDRTVLDPAMMQWQQRVLPGIQQEFVDANAGSSSALNQALGKSAQDLTIGLGSQYGQFAQNQRQNQLVALGQMGQLAGQQTFQPTTETTQPWGPELLQGLGMLGAGSLAGGGTAGLGPLLNILKSIFGGGGQGGVAQ